MTEWWWWWYDDDDNDDDNDDDHDDNDYDDSVDNDDHDDSKHILNERFPGSCLFSFLDTRFHFIPKQKYPRNKTIRFILSMVVMMMMIRKMILLIPMMMTMMITRIAIYMYIYLVGFSKMLSTVISPVSWAPPSPNFPVSSSYKNCNCLNIRTS